MRDFRLRQFVSLNALPCVVALLVLAGCTPATERQSTPVLETDNVKIHVGPETPAGDEKKSADAE